MPSYEEELQGKFWKGFVAGYFFGITAVLSVHWIFT
jgi:hypothetical protein